MRVEEDEVNAVMAEEHKTAASPDGAAIMTPPGEDIRRSSKDEVKPLDTTSASSREDEVPTPPHEEIRLPAKGAIKPVDTTSATSPEETTVSALPRQVIRSRTEDAVKPRQTFSAGSDHAAAEPTFRNPEKDGDQKKAVKPAGSGEESETVVTTEEEHGASQQRRSSILRDRPDIHDVEPYLVWWRKFVLSTIVLLLLMLVLLAPTVRRIRKVTETCDDLQLPVVTTEGSLTRERLTTTDSTFPGHDTDVQLVQPSVKPLEAVVSKPIHCTYHCRQASGVQENPPPDGLCDFVYFQNRKDLSLADYDRSGCSTLLTTAASKAVKTLYGISIYVTMAEKSEQDLRTSSGMVKFKELWNSNVTCHGINFHIDPFIELKKFAGYGFLKRAWYLQRVMAGFQEKPWQVPYILAGVQFVYTDYRHERRNITDVLNALGRYFKVNLLVLNTHSMKYAEQVPFKAQFGCTASGPTLLHGDGTSDVSLFSAREVLLHATIPSYVRVMVSFSAAVHQFTIRMLPGSIASYAGQCTKQDFTYYSLACSNELQNRQHAEKPNVESAVKSSPPGIVVVWETGTGVLDKAGNITKWLPKVELGFSVDHVEYAYVAAKAQFKCQDVSDYPIVSAVRNATGKPPL